MKARFLHGAALWTFLFAATFATSCSDDENDYKDVDGKNPVVELTSDHIRTLTGYEFKIAGKVSDKDGIRSIRLQSSELFLDKTIDLVALYPEPMYEYDLNYGFTIPEETEGDNYTVNVTVTDLGGRIVQNEILITMDGDYTEPKLFPSTNLTSENINIALTEDNPMRFRFTATDEIGLAYLELTIPDLNILERVDLGGEGTTEGTFEKDVAFPSDETGAYIMTISAVDAFENVTEKEYTILITKAKDYPNMYLVDFADTDNSLLTNYDSWGIPMPIEHTGIFEYKALYYSAAQNTPVRFITNKENFNSCFGDDKNNPGKLTTVKDNMNPIILPEKGYYEISFNIETETYAVSPYIPNDAPYNGENGQLSIVGGGFLNNPGWWDTSNPYLLTQDSDNPYIYTGTLIFNNTDRNFLDCTIAPKGGWGPPSWRFDGKNERFVPGDAVPNSSRTNIEEGEYTFIFDTHLCQSKLIKKNN